MFAAGQSDPTLARMRATVVTDDFRTGFVGGHMWQGPEGLAESPALWRRHPDEGLSR